MQKKIGGAWLKLRNKTDQGIVPQFELLEETMVS